MGMAMKRMMLTAIGVAMLAGPAAAEVVITNGGDFSDDNLDPTNLGSFNDDFSVGGSVVNALGIDTDPPTEADVDVITFTLDEGFQLVGATFTGVSTDNLGFIAFTTGETFPLDAEGLGALGADGVDLSAAPFIAGGLYAAGPDGVTTDLLDLFANGAAAGSVLATGELGDLTGQLTFYIQQLGGAAVDYQIDFEVAEIPVPSAFILMATGAAGLAGMRRRRRKAAR